MVLSAHSLQEAVKPHLLNKFYQEYPRWLLDKACDTRHEQFVSARARGEAWNPLSCCKERVIFYNTAPRLFKVEYFGDGMVALCSKTYYAFGDKTKASCKRLNKHLNDLTKEKFLKVLTGQESGAGLNRGFRSLHTRARMKFLILSLYQKESMRRRYFNRTAFIID